VSGERRDLGLDSIRLPAAHEAEVSDREVEGNGDARKGVEYEDRVVAFVDILGFKNIIRRSAREPALVPRIQSALSLPRHDWAEMFAPLIDGESVSGGERTHSFSDFIVMSVPPDPPAVGLLVYMVFKKCRQLLEAGFASRGGIARGPIFHEEGEAVFGPAFVDAYLLESTHADGPRVILQNAVRTLIETYCAATPDSTLCRFFAEHVKRAEDGPATINLFADFRENSFYAKRPDIESSLRKMHQVICSALDDSADAPQIFRKNAQLARAFNQALHGSGYEAYLIRPDKLPAQRP
jgi:hypothetical protein